MNKREFTRHYLSELREIITRVSERDIEQILQIIDVANQHGRSVYLIGNGGSAATASHMANDLLKAVGGYESPHLRPISLTDSAPIITATANDKGYAEVYSIQIESLAEPDDVLIAISASGKSPNIVAAVNAARARGLKIIALLGMGGGEVVDLADASLVVDSYDYGPIEDVHMALNHLIAAYLRSASDGGS